ERFTIRQNALKEMEAVGDVAAPAVRAALAANPSPEVARRLQGLLAKWDAAALPAETVRDLRGVEVLEVIKTPDARALLAEVAQGDPAARLTREAAESLGRLK